ncbi:MIP18 family protein galla-2 [Galendromus occidentalis]|uniref:MIP18 family protein galla-2 n=1 Tax=Galendromus occidentalis TaxID=34638 RepID=A0AAJ6QYV9_9ACAR|nr:MIP18 family protein galla-2 [Galendromus occidentalis]
MVLNLGFGSFQLENAAPQVFATVKDRPVTAAELDDAIEDPIDAREVFDLIRDINDPEHPLTLEQLKVVAEELVTVDPATRVIKVMFTPTIPHCSMATLIGLCIRVKLMRSLPREFKIDLMITPGKHDQERAINKQLQDKERVAAALENPNLLSVVNKCIAEPEY